MKTSSDDLFLLIKSLEKNEKRYFRLFSSFHGGNKNYMLMFNAIEKQKIYDEKHIIALFRREKIASQFPLIKRYLHALILSSLRGYRTSVESTLYNHLQNISILYEKGLYTQCKKVIKIAKQLAIKYDLQLPLLELLRWDWRLIYAHSFINTDEDKIREVYNTMFGSMEEYKTATAYQFMNSLLLLKSGKTGNIRSRSDMKAVEKIMEETEKGKGISFQSLYRSYMAYGMYFFLLNDYENAHLYYQKLVQLQEAHPHQIVENPLAYAQSLMDIFVSCLYLKKYRECADIIEKLKKLQVKLLNVRKHIEFLIDDMGLTLCLETGAFEEGLQLIKSMESKWENFIMIPKGKILLLKYNTACLYFGIGNYHKANESLNKILNESIDTRNDVQCFAQILSLIVHFELGNQDLLEYRVKSVHRFLYHRNSLYKVENIILDFIRKDVPEINSAVETQYIASLQKSFEALLTKMKSIANNPFERRAFEYFDFISWLKSKIQKRPFAEVVREKYPS